MWEFRCLNKPKTSRATLQLLLIPNTFCCSLHKQNCVCAVIKFLLAINFVIYWGWKGMVVHRHAQAETKVPTLTCWYIHLSVQATFVSIKHCSIAHLKTRLLPELKHLKNVLITLQTVQNSWKIDGWFLLEDKMCFIMPYSAL